MLSARSICAICVASVGKKDSWVACCWLEVEAVCVSSDACSGLDGCREAAAS